MTPSCHCGRGGNLRGGGGGVRWVRFPLSVTYMGGRVGNMKRV